MTGWWLLVAVKVVIVAAGVMTAAAYLVLLERKLAAWVQDRIGPNRVGIPLTRIRLFGLGQPLADGLKFIFKEEFTPGHVDRWLYWVAPVAILTVSLAAFAVIPFGSVLPSSVGVEGEHPIQLVVAPGIHVGLLFVFAMGSIAVYGVILGGWASNNKYSFLGALRSSAQLIAYELPLGLGILGVVATAGTLDLQRIITTQAETGCWFVFTQPLGFVVLVIAAFAEAARLPFDLPECEQELVGGYHTEYAGMKLLLFLVSEFLHMITGAFLIVILFLGGWHFWGLTGSAEEVGWFRAILRVVVLLAKVFAVILFFQVVRWSWPRFRFDQLMSFCWRVLLPLGMVNLAAVAVFWEVFVSESWLPGGRLGAAIGGWLVLIVSGYLLGRARPVIADNRPAATLMPHDIDWQVP